jgi:hypothetical protein
MDSTEMNLDTCMDIKSAINDASASLKEGARFWTIHVDELKSWSPAKGSALDWFRSVMHVHVDLARNLEEINHALIAVSLQPTVLPIKQELTGDEIKFDFFTPPAIYIASKALELPETAERYQFHISNLSIGGNSFYGQFLLVSSRTLEGQKNNWEFDNSIYIL